MGNSIRCIYDFITIYTDGTSAKSTADYIDDLHSLIDKVWGTR